METYYIGCIEYAITFYNGAHYVIDNDAYIHDLTNFIMFSGTYDQCLNYRTEQEHEYSYQNT